MVSWPKGPNKADGAWAPFWYKSVHASSGFIKQKEIPKLNPLPDHLIKVYDEVMPSYQFLFSKSIKAD